MREFLRQIKEEHIIYAIDQLNKNGWDPKKNSTKFDLLYKENKYPPKMVIRYAGTAATGHEPKHFSGGKDSNELLMRFGFTIIDKVTGLPINDNKSAKFAKSITEQDLRIEKQVVENLFNSKILSETERLEMVKIRVGQGIYRNLLLSLYTTCMLCNVNNVKLLIASHIKPWKDCTSDERLEMNNGLLLCPNHDSLFDKGYISFDDNGHIVISTDLSDTNRTFMNVNESMKVEFTGQSKEYMKWHLTHVFKTHD